MSRKKPWGGRFKEATNELVEEFTESLHFDKKLYEEDIKGSIVHARMLGKTGIIPSEDAERIVEGLNAILSSIKRGEFPWDPALEDVHMNIEAELVRRIGEPGKRLHTARSRNDQVATATRLFVKKEIKALDKGLERLQKSLLQQAKTYDTLVMPGFTHLQHAQPVLWSHHMMAYFEMFRRDRERLKDCLKRVDVCPLGSAALAGTPFPIDREFVARELGFSQISRNSMDAVSDRDFVAEFIFCTSLIMVHLSRLSEELILWSSQEFAFVDLPDRFCTGSSIMPQKKNPDCPELIRGKSGRVIGDLVAILTVLKGLPLTYNRDLQEDKEALFDACQTALSSVEIMAQVISGMAPRKDRMEQATRKGFLTATDLADYLVENGVPFRSAHEVVGRIVAYCVEKKREIPDLELQEIRAFSKAIDGDCFERLDINGSISKRASMGGTAPERVKEAIHEAERWLKGFSCG